MPSGYVETENGIIPIGVQIIGGMDKDNDVLKAGYCFREKIQIFASNFAFNFVHASRQQLCIFINFSKAFT